MVVDGLDVILVVFRRFGCCFGWYYLGLGGFSQHCNQFWLVLRLDAILDGFSWFRMLFRMVLAGLDAIWWF